MQFPQSCFRASLTLALRVNLNARRPLAFWVHLVADLQVQSVCCFIFTLVIVIGIVQDLAADLETQQTELLSSLNCLNSSPTYSLSF